MIQKKIRQPKGNRMYQIKNIEIKNTAVPVVTSIFLTSTFFLYLLGILIFSFVNVNPCLL